MRFLRIRPAVWAMISCSFSSFTLKVALGSSSVTTPGNSSISSFAIRLLPASKFGGEWSQGRTKSRRIPGLREWSAAPGPSALPVQRAEQGEQAAGGGDIDGDLALEPLLEELAPLIVQPAPSHVDRLDLGSRLGLDRLIITVAD